MESMVFGFLSSLTVEPACEGTVRCRVKKCEERAIVGAPMSDDLPECLDCGACCFGDRPDYVPVRGDDYGRLGDAAEELTRWQGNRCFLRMAEGHCAALVLDAGLRRFVCSTYETRPDTCRVLARGSAECAGERFEKSARARDALTRVITRHEPLAP